jgi:UDP-N-acetylglucosamine 4,6-dehydratase
VAKLADALAPGVPQRVIGLQSGEKLHETLIGPDEAARTVDRGDHYVILPAHQSWGDGATDGRPVGAHFVLRSDLAPTWSVDELRGMAA